MQLALIAADLVAITVLAFAVYFPRYRRRDMVVAFFGLNVGTLAVATTLTSTPISAGLGLGLFGVLSLVRLRSDELGQEEVAYYFSALSLGLLAGLQPTPDWVAPALMLLVVAVMFVVGHPGMLGRHHHAVMTLDRALADRTLAQDYAEELLGRPISHLNVRKVDYVNDSTQVEVNYRTDQPA